ncbi:c-type cytochrome [Dethiobacter alkaliphilus]|uniref:c-type cytochrome n=1 Tax=Dethiobacter alkaliphilus TaxID=427926 RepID=UPI0022271DBE|nr:cytochrome c [Dethiobacter alkaliphilus]MCW3489525.1 cytochrome c [Dethiobacter alkaliphilus]
MKKTEIWYLLISLTTVIGFAVLIYYSILRVNPSVVPPEAAAGKEIWERQGCMQCHAIMGSGGYSASDLTDVVTRHSEEWLEEFFLNPPLMEPSHRRHPGLAGAEIVHMLTFLRLVDEIDNLDWPPAPLITVPEDLETKD